jgi:hypothetical protein
MPEKNSINAESQYIKQLTFQRYQTESHGIIFHGIVVYSLPTIKFTNMQVIQITEVDVTEINKVDSSKIKCFAETPWKTGVQKPLKRIGAFDLFNLFTADIIRSKKVFTR